MSKSRDAPTIRLRTLDWIGRGDIPVYEGLARPIVRNDFPTPRASKRDPKVHLADPAVSGADVDQAAAARPAISRARPSPRHPGEIVLVAVGPLSNLAAAIALDPGFPGHVAELIIMGGAIDKSNVTPSAEFNIWADPEAAAVVLDAAFPKITLVPLDATHQALISRDQCAAIARARLQRGQGDGRARRIPDRRL